MDPSASPWRVLEDPPGPGSERAGGPAAEPTALARVPRSALVTIAVAVALVVAAFALAFGSGLTGSVAVVGGEPLSSDMLAGGASDDPGGAASKLLVVEIVGAVERPGVFRLAAGSRIGDLVKAAGGFGPRVDTERAGRELNLAATLKDGDQVRVPSRDDTSGAPTTAGPGGGIGGGNGVSGPVDLNTATDAQLDELPGIGPVTAAKIIGSREDQAFATVDDLRTRKLVGEKTFEQLKDLVTVR